MKQNDSNISKAARSLPEHISEPGCTATDQATFLSPGRGLQRYPSPLQPSLRGLMERRWPDLGPKWCIVPWAKWEAEAKEVKIHSVCEWVSDLSDLDVHTGLVWLREKSLLLLNQPRRCTQNGSEWIRALPLEPCGPFKDAAFCLKKRGGGDPNLNQCNSSSRHQWLKKTNTDREGATKREREWRKRKKRGH